MAWVRQASCLAQGVAQYVFDLRVEAAQLVVSPALCRGQDLGIDAQRIGFFSLMKTPGGAVGRPVARMAQ
ncbi:hypothetical protein VM57_05400 [Stenotrophomonas maltophilia]|uniref:Uncharacterized protein n=1 Tax=Stenotrophomonas maltophilia TaxID=40324 RepID=A0A0F5ZP31_STEMA|nr:hypothetical protein VM57_05400 [Stenotrophomonas maltophilia]